MLNSTCPHLNCGGNAVRHTTLKSGLVQYRCKSCKRYFTPGSQHGGQNKINDGLTPQQRWDRANRAKLSELQRQRRKKDL